MPAWAERPDRQAGRIARTMEIDAQKLEFMREFLESAHNGVVVVDHQGRIMVFNRAARTLAGLKPDQVEDRFIGDLFPESWEDMRLILDGGEAQTGKRVNIGQAVIVANRTAFKHNGEIKGVLSIFQNVGELESLAAELEIYKELSEQLDVIIESSHDGLWISDAKGNVLRVNQASLNFAGLKAEEVIGKNMRDLVAAGQFDRSATLEVLKHGTAVSLVQTQYDGKQVMVTGNPVRDDDGNIKMVVINARDLTTLNRLQAELEESRVLTKQLGSELSQLHKLNDLDSKIVMRSASMARVFETAMRVAQVDSSVIIMGESGVGKGLMAKIIHQASPRQHGPLVRVDCGGIPESLIEAELFGYEKGAFTGALQNGKPGYFELAHGGTLMLDEVGELPIALQAKLLRFLEDNEVVRVGSTTPRHIDVRVIAATNRNLERMVEVGQFRGDLFFRLQVVPIILPPLRERVEDIPPLIQHFMELFNRKCGTDKKILPEAVDVLCRYQFPGNVRELANMVEQLVVLTPRPMVGVRDLPASARHGRGPELSAAGDGDWQLPEAVAKLETEIIVKAVKRHGSLRRAAKHLGIDHSTLSRKIKKHGISLVDILHHGVIKHR